MRFCTVFLLSFTLLSPIVLNPAYSAEAPMADVFDIDGNGKKESLSDGLLLLRYFFGFRGTELTTGAIGAGATRTSSSQIENYISSHLAELDIDGSGDTSPLSDGLLALRYQFGFRGDSLINGAIKAGATRKTATEVETFIRTANNVDEFSQSEYKGLSFYHRLLPASDYTLNQLTDSEFNLLSEEQKLQVADKLLSSFFFGYPLSELKTKIASGSFLSGVRSGLEVETTNKGVLEDYILDNNYFTQYSNWSEPQAITILARFYAMDDLDKYFFNNWVSYILTQTIMFSPAYELNSTHTPNIAGVYNRLVNMLDADSGMRYITYKHMMSEDNWRRFRSSEDNGREMLEIFLQDESDNHVALSGIALKNWTLHSDSDTLQVGLNKNTVNLTALTEFFGGQPVITGEDFYRELVKSDRFTTAVTQRLVDFFFPEKTMFEKQQITNSIVISNPETWQDILLQILFSEEYLLHNNRGQSAEETFYSLAKKMDYRHRRSTFYELKSYLEEMHQATMKYKLGKLNRVPEDTLSFANYHSFIRERVLMRQANPEQTDPDRWDYYGWMPTYTASDQFVANPSDHVSSLRSLVDYLFESTIARKATNDEHALFRNHIIEQRNGENLFRRWEFHMFETDSSDPQTAERRRRERKSRIVGIVLDYISRLDAIYRQSEVN